MDKIFLTDSVPLWLLSYAVHSCLSYLLPCFSICACVILLIITHFNAYSMKDILVKCGLPEPNRAGFIKCPFHKGDHEASMKIYDKDFHCFGCGANGDIFTFTERFYGISFKDAFLMLGGEYEKNPSFRSSLAIYRAKKEKLMREKQEAKMRDKCRLNNDLISVYREFLNRAEPLSDAWCDCYNALQLELYHAELLEERR